MVSTKVDTRRLYIDTVILDFRWPLNRPRSTSQDFSTKYLEYSERHSVGHNDGQTGNHLWICDWHYELWPLMTLNCPSSRSLKFHIKYFRNGDIGLHDGGFDSWSRIRNHPWVIDWRRDLWPWMALNRPRSKLPTLHYIFLQKCHTLQLVVWYYGMFGGGIETALGRYTFHSRRFWK